MRIHANQKNMTIRKEGACSRVEGSLKFCGIKKIKVIKIGSITNISDEKRKKWLDRVGRYMGSLEEYVNQKINTTSIPYCYHHSFSCSFVSDSWTRVTI